MASWVTTGIPGMLKVNVTDAPGRPRPSGSLTTTVKRRSVGRAARRSRYVELDNDTASRPEPRRTDSVAVPWLPAGSVAVSWITLLPGASGRLSVKVPSPSAVAMIESPLVVFLALIVERAWVLPFTLTALALTTDPLPGDVTFRVGFDWSRM